MLPANPWPRVGRPECAGHCRHSLDAFRHIRALHRHALLAMVGYGETHAHNWRSRALPQAAVTSDLPRLAASAAISCSGSPSRLAAAIARPKWESASALALTCWATSPAMA